jgi:hypothetical protein
MSAFRTAFVVNGATLSPAVKSIAISQDGASWTHLFKSQVRKVSRIYIPFVQASEANRGYPWRDSATINIEMGGTDSVKFDVQGISGQNSWVVASAEHPSGTAVSVEAGLQQAVEDITSWV